MSGIIVLILRILVLAALYGFLGWTIYTIWMDLRAQANRISSPHIPVITLKPLAPDQKDTHSFENPEVILGRSTANELSIVNETVSSRHARLSFHHNHWWVEDLHSTNGTFLNDERVSMPTVIVAGDEVRVGNMSWLVEIDDKKT